MIKLIQKEQIVTKSSYPYETIEILTLKINDNVDIKTVEVLDLSGTIRITFKSFNHITGANLFKDFDNYDKNFRIYRSSVIFQEYDNSMLTIKSKQSYACDPCPKDYIKKY